MSRRNRGGGHQHSVKGAGLPPPILDTPPPHPYARGHFGPPLPHHALLDELRDPPLPFPRGAHLPPHPAIIEERLAAQHHELQALLVDNQRLAATHVALIQERAAAQHELQHMTHVAGSMHAEKDLQLRELYDKSLKIEADLQASESLRAELMQVRAGIQKLSASRQELTNQVQALTQDLTRANAELQQAPALKMESDAMKQELHRARAAIEYEKKAHAENYEQGQAMEKDLISMAWEVEKLRAEIANVEKRARASAAAGNPGTAYGGNCSNADAVYASNSYPVGYAVDPVQGGADPGSQYGIMQNVWGAYDMKRAHGRR
ncbi:protein FLX-like 1 [Aristolochia californica]|uniref:protein FLX-like 1 n=1 Tax=Aristolochia californica TaxID=171875 RepID=UPI0035D9A813